MTTESTWKEKKYLKEVFLENYFPQWFKGSTDIVIQRLYQESMAVAEYAERIKSMSAYSKQVLYAPENG